MTQTAQVVDTVQIEAAARTLKSINDNIDREFGVLQGKAKDLESCWNSAAANEAIEAMYSIFQRNEPRSAIMQNYSNMLMQQVHQGYVETESANQTLADQYK